jgi:hypothetical protein
VFVPEAAKLDAKKYWYFPDADMQHETVPEPAGTVMAPEVHVCP